MLTAPQPQGGAVWLLDAHNLLHRYFHAVPVQWQAGRQVHAVRGLRNLLVRICEQSGPKAVGIVYDAGHSGRGDLLPTYKTGRPPTPPELDLQIDMARTYLPTYGAETIQVEGYEADDVIVSLTLSARACGDRVYLVTSDKDLMCVVSDSEPEVAVYNRATGKAAEGWRLYKEADVLARLGVRPNRVLDMLALVGDDADNIPGVPGVGPATAAELLRVYGDLPTLLGAIGSVKRPAIKLALREHAEQIRLARKVLEPVILTPAQIMESIRAQPTQPPPTPPRP